MSVIISVSSGAAARSSLITRRGSIGTASEAFSCSMKFDHSALQPSTWSCQRERSRFGPALLGQLAQLPQHLAGVADDAELGRVVAADLLRVDVDVDELVGGMLYV